MKVIAVATLMLLASANALPSLTEDELRQQRVVTDTIIAIINDISNRIVDAGLDPLIIDDAEVSYALSDPEIFSINAWVKELRFCGLSNIAINRINFSILQTRLTFDISLPEVALRIGSSALESTVYGNEITGSASGSVKIIQARIVGDVRASVGVISGITIRDLNLSFSLGGIQSDLELVVLDRDLSESVNDALNNILPALIKENEAKINELLEAIAWIVVDQIF